MSNALHTYDWNSGDDLHDFFTYDFDSAELLTLRRRQVRPYRDPRFDWQFGFVPLADYLRLARESGVGVYVEVKHGAATNRVSERHIYCQVHTEIGAAES